MMKLQRKSIALKNKVYTMKVKNSLPVLITFLFTVGCHQTGKTDSGLNLDFEVSENGMPKGWSIYPKSDYSVFVDSKNVQSGKYSIAIESAGNTVDAQAVFIALPNNYDGERVTLSGYMKTENVTDGHAGLWIIKIPEMACDSVTVTGTADWNKYEITLDLNPAQTQYIIIGGGLTGKGKMWLDGLQVTIDSVDIKDAKVYERKPLPAELDKAFNLSSNIVIPLSEKFDSKEDKILIANLELLGKLWGFLKYHHPEVGKGEYNWDNELFRILPEYLKVTGTAQRDEILLQWIEKYGELPECKTCRETSADAIVKPDFSWVENTGMSSILKEKIKEIYRNRHQGEHFYIKMEPVGNPVFTNEKDYPHMPCPDAYIRLLALYRYWNMIQYFFPSRHLTDKNWNQVLKEYIPKFVLVETELEYQLAILLLTGEINDSHANLSEPGNKVDSLRGSWQAPFRVRFIENKLVVTDYYKPELKETSGLNTGDVITHINGKKIEYIVDSVKIYYPASNEASKMKNLANDLVRSRNKSILIEYISSDRVKQKKELTLYERKRLNMNRKDQSICYNLIYENILVTKDLIGYITLKTIKKSDIDNIKKLFGNTKGIIIDIRNYPSTYVPYLLGSYFVSDDMPFVRFTRGNINNPGEFNFDTPLRIPKSEEPYQGKLIVIVNEESISQSEYTAMAFRAGDHTTIIGSQTAGADGNVSEIVLPGGLKTRISGVGVYYPDGRETQRIGIVPDIDVKPTIQGIREGRDELLERAVEMIRQQ
jgi:C-terminal processing protease CtpA/Prc